MLTSLAIAGLRGISSAELNNLASINVLVGANSSGKTTALEAIALALDGEAAYQYVLKHREGVTNRPESLCRDGSRFRVEARTATGGYELSVKAAAGRAYFEHRAEAVSTSGYAIVEDVDPPRAFIGQRVRYIDIDRGRGYDLEEELAHIETSNERAAFLALARNVLPAVTDVRLVLVSGKPQVHVEESVGDSTVRWPLSSGGDGIRRLLLVAGRMAGAHPIHLLEDPEAFQHPKALRTVAELLWRKSESSQLFVSTHSIDFIRAMVEDINGEPRASQIRIFLLNRDGHGMVTVTQMSGAQAQVKHREQQLRQALGYR